MFKTLPDVQQPLFIDTNFDYDLDMSTFPGLNDPQCINQPALLIASDCDINETYICVDNTTVLTDMDDNVIQDLITSDVMDADTLLTLVDDIIYDQDISTCLMDIGGTSYDVNSICHENIQHVAEYIVDNTFLRSDTPDSLNRHNTERSDLTDDTLTTEAKIRKHFEVYNVEHHDETKPSGDYPTFILPTFSLCHRDSDQCVLLCRRS